MSESITVWSRSKLNPYWLVERTYPGKYAIEVLGLPELAGETIVGDDNRLYAWFPVDTVPNDIICSYCYKLKQELTAKIRGGIENPAKVCNACIAELGE